MPTTGSVNTAFVQAMLPATPVRTTQLEFAPYQTLAVVPVGSVQVPPSAAHVTAFAGGVDEGVPT